MNRKINFEANQKTRWKSYGANLPMKIDARSFLCLYMLSYIKLVCTIFRSDLLFLLF